MQHNGSSHRNQKIESETKRQTLKIYNDKIIAGSPRVSMWLHVK